VAQIVYKALYESFLSGDSNVEAWDVWFMGNLGIYIRHIDTIMKAGAGTLVAPAVSETSYVPSEEEQDGDIPF